MLKIVGSDPADAAPGSPASRSDELRDLAVRAARGDRTAVHDLLVAVGPAMMRAVRRVLGRRTRDLEDVVQDAMEGLLSALPGFRGEATVLHFAYRVAVLSALVHRRRLAVREQWSADDPDAADNHPGTLGPAPAEDGVARARRKRALGTLLDELPTAQSEVLVLHFVLGFTIEEVAASVVAALTGAQARDRPACASGPGAAGDRGSPHGAVVELSIVGDEAGAARLRDVLLEQLGGAGVAVQWRRSERFQPRDILSPSPTQQPATLNPAIAVSVRIDLSAPPEARIYLKDRREDRFVVRRLLLPKGVDEIAREEIGHIVRSATLGILVGSTPALTREEARAALDAPPPAESLPSSPRPAARPAPPPPPLPSQETTRPAPRRAVAAPAARPASAGGLAVEIGASWAVQPFARGIWWTHEAAVAAALWSGAGRWGVWLETGRRLPVDFTEEAIGVGIDASSLRLGGTVELRPGARLMLRLGGGAGMERITFQPRAGTAPIELAPRDSFLVPSGRVFVGGAFHLAIHAVLTLRLLCDVEAADVHYDIEDAAGGGGVRRALTPFRLRPGISFGVAWRS